MDDSQPFDNTAPGDISGAVVNVTKRKERNFYGFEHFNKVLMLSENNDQLINRFDRIHSEKGKILGRLNTHGYLAFDLFGHIWFVHRVIWLLHHKKWPTKFVDHKDMDKTNNDINNLREATGSENQHNRKKYISNTSSEKCICYHRPTGKLLVYVRLNKKPHYGGCFTNMKDAVIARDKLVTHLHGKFANFS